MTITALPSEIKPVTNKRNAVMIQTFMTDSLAVTPDRGVVRFVPIQEEYLATNGTTVLGEIENLSRETNEGNGGADTSSKRSGTLRRKLSRQTSRPEKLNLQQQRSRPGTSEQLPSPALKSPPIPAMPEDMIGPMDKKAEKVRKMGRRRSFMAMFAGNRPKTSA